jgi:ankyrin repeat protein
VPCMGCALSSSALATARRQTVEKNLYFPLMCFFLIAFSCARQEETGKVAPLNKQKVPAPAEKSAQAERVFSAVENGDDKQLDQLLAQGADVNYKRPSDGVTPLHLIAQNGRAPIGGYLISGGADVNAKDNSGNTPLHWAAQNGHLAVVKILVDKGSDVNAKRGDGATPLDLAISKGNVQLVEYLKRSGAKSSTSP